MTNNLIELYYKMVLIRRFEEKVLEYFTHKNIGKIFGTTHVYIGEEAVAVGACAPLRKDDYITSTHRGHGHFIAKGGDPKRIMAELFGKETGYSKGRGGTQHMGDMSISNLGSNGITGGGIPIATGAAFSAKYRETGQIVVCFFGDGAVNEGYFHESLNFASIWNLPIIYVCENNLYAMSTPVEKAFPIANIANRADAYNIEGKIVDGMDVLEVKNVVEKAVEKARDERGPTLIECKTYRFVGHSKSDRCAYRTREEEREWKKRDPINNLKERLLKDNLYSENDFSNIENKVESEINEAIDFADESPWPKKEELYNYLFCEGDSQ